MQLESHLIGGREQARLSDKNPLRAKSESVVVLLIMGCDLCIIVFHFLREAGLDAARSKTLVCIAGLK